MSATHAVRVVRLATRGSALARWQAGWVAERLRAEGRTVEEHAITTVGDRTTQVPIPQIGQKGVFTAELEAALLGGTADIAVHSLKDLPVEDADGVTTAAVCCRDDPRDVLVSRSGAGIDALDAGARVGTSSSRRTAQLLLTRPDLIPISIRGNVETRLDKVTRGGYDAVILAAAGVERLGLGSRITEYLSPDRFLPAPGQGALAVQCRDDDEETRALLTALDDPAVRAAVGAERSFLRGVGGGCSAPVGALAEITADGALHLRGFVGAADGSSQIRVSHRGTPSMAVELGAAAAAEACAGGAGALLR